MKSETKEFTIRARLNIVRIIVDELRGECIMALTEFLINAVEHVPVFSIGKSIVKVVEGDIDGAIETLSEGVGRSMMKESLRRQHDSDDSFDED